MTKKIIISMSYAKHSIFSHPETMEEFTNLQDRFMKSFEDEDMRMMMIAACQLMPDHFITEEVTNEK